MEPIIIEVQDNEWFGEIALFVDGDGFLSDLLEARNILVLPNPVSYSQYEEFLTRENIKGRSWKNYTPHKIGDLLNFITSSLRGKYKKPFYFDEVIKKSIVCHEVREADFKKVAIDMIYIGSEAEELDWDRRDFLSKYDPSIAIIITPQRHTKKLMDEIKSAYKEQVPRLLEKYKALLHYEDVENYTNPSKEKINKISNYSADTKGEIRRDRKWHWLNKNGKTYLEIAEEEYIKESRGHAEDYIKTIERAVARYRKRLES